MNSLLIFLSLLFSTDYNIYIALDDSKNSQVMQRELTRNWTEVRLSPIPEELKELQAKQDTIKSSIFLVDRYDYKLCNKHRIPRLTKYPQYRVGEYRDFQDFDQRTFLASSFPLLSIYAIKLNADADVMAWEDKCKEIQIKHMSDYTTEIIAWGYANKAEDINLISQYEQEDTDDTIKEIAKKYSSTKGFPVYKTPILPKNPVVKFPWER